MSQPPVYLISGLCADERLFHNLKVNHPAPRHIQWIRPLPYEKLSDYAKRLLPQIEASEEPPILIGLSFGGMVAQEIAKLVPIKRLILISSLIDTDQLPLHYRVGGFLLLHHWLPLGLAKHWMAPGHWLFGAHSSHDQHIFNSIIRDTDLPLLRWSLAQILKWRHKAIPAEVVVIHGDKDKILPLPNHPEVHVIKGGGHLIILNRAEEVNALVNQYLD